MGWRLAKSLEVLRKQVNAAAPKRDKSNDGTIGDTAHSSRKSDHNPNKSSVVQALDITHDPKNGMDSYALAEAMRLSQDKRIKYVISNGRIFSSTEKPWVWRKYSGANKHSVHVHISVSDQPAFYDNESPWDIGLKPATYSTQLGVYKPVGEKVGVNAVIAGPQTVTKPAIKSKSIWAAVSTFAVSIGGALTDWRVAAVIVVGLLAAFLIWDRMRRSDIKGVLK